VNFVNIVYMKVTWGSAWALAKLEKLALASLRQLDGEILLPPPNPTAGQKVGITLRSLLGDIRGDTFSAKPTPIE